MGGLNMPLNVLANQNRGPDMAVVLATTINLRQFGAITSMSNRDQLLNMEAASRRYGELNGVKSKS